MPASRPPTNERAPMRSQVTFATPPNRNWIAWSAEPFVERMEEETDGP